MDKRISNLVSLALILSTTLIFPGIASSNLQSSIYNNLSIAEIPQVNESANLIYNASSIVNASNTAAEAATSEGVELVGRKLNNQLDLKANSSAYAAMFERQARNPLRGCTKYCSSNNSAIATANICPCNLRDYFDQENSNLWLKSDWKNTDPVYLNAWLPDPNHIDISNGNLCLILDNEPCTDDVSLCHGQDFASGQYYTTCDDFRYGSLSAMIMAGKGNGVITSMYLFEDEGAAGEQDEIDIEIFGKDSVAPGRWEMQTNYFRKGDMGDCWVPYGIPEPCHVGVIPLNFDPTKSYHNYTISWIGNEDVCTDIKWYVDEKLRRHVWLDGSGYIHSSIFDESGNIIESSNAYTGSLPNAGCRIILGLWAAQNWNLAGEFNYVSPIAAKFDWMVFSQPNCVSDRVGVFRNGAWFLDLNGNRYWDLPGDVGFGWGLPDDLPVAGDWNGDGKDEVGVFRNGAWFLDLNGNRYWDLPGDVGFGWGLPDDLPVAGDWNGDGKDEVGVFRNGAWFLDLNGNRYWDLPGDVGFGWGLPDDLPVAGDWNGDGKDEVGVFRDGAWFLDLNGNRYWDLPGDVGFGWGLPDDLPVAGDWNGDGKDEVSVFRNGAWFLDLNGNRYWDLPGDVGFGWGLPDDKPVSGGW